MPLILRYNGGPKNLAKTKILTELYKISKTIILAYNLKVNSFIKRGY